MENVTQLTHPSQVQTSSQTERARFFSHLYQHCEGRIELRPIPSGVQAFFDADDHAGIEAFCLKHQHEHVYFGVGTRDGRGGRKENVVEIPAVWCDVDYKDTPPERLAENLKKFPSNPSITVESGGGLHLYWILSEPANQSDLEAVVQVNRQIAAALGGDAAATDAARILRVPGTLNVKYQPPAACLLKGVEDFETTLDHFRELLPEVEQPKTAEHSQNSTPWLDTAMQGVSQGRRNTTATSLVGYWRRKGLSLADTRAVMAVWNGKNDPPMTDRELQAVIKSVSRCNKKDPDPVEISNQGNRLYPWPDNKRAVPNPLTRSPVFAVIRPGWRQMLDRRKIPSQSDADIWFSGWQLDQSDCDVWLQALELAKHKDLGTRVYFNRAAFLRALGRRVGSSGYQWLDDSLYRLVDATVTIETELYLTHFHLLDGYDLDKKAGDYWLSISPKAKAAFDRDYTTHTDLEQRLLIARGQQLAKWLQNYVCGHKRGLQHTRNLLSLYEWSGVSGPLRNFRSIGLPRALKKLERVGVITGGWVRPDDMVTWFRPWA